MPVPAEKVTSLEAELIDGGPIPEIRLAQIIRELRAIVEKGSAGLLARAHAALGIAYMKRGPDWYDEALKHHRIACDLDRNNPGLLHNYAVSLSKAGDLQRGLEKELAALDLPGGRTALILAHVARLLSQFGEESEARRVFEQAAAMLPDAPHGHVLRVAALAAEMGLHRDALEMTARYLGSAPGRDVLDVLREAPSSFFERELQDSLPLRWAIEYALKAPPGHFATLQALADASPSAAPAACGSEVLDDEFLATKHWRDGATTATFDGGPGDASKD